MKKWRMILIAFWFGLSSCSRQVTRLELTTAKNGRYDSEFPMKNCSQQLKEIGETIKLLNSVVYYKCFILPENSRIRDADLSTISLKESAVQQIYFSNSASGTVSIISFDGSRLLLMTCAHIIDFPDTIIKYQHQDDPLNKFVHSVSIKEKQTNYISDLPGTGEISVLLIDENLDFALLSQRFSDGKVHNIPVFNYPFGKAKNLEWGSFVYLLGYPRGYKMVTKGLVSDPNRNKDGAFLLDAIFNRGFSGGIVLAIRDGVPNFELVGIAKSAAAEYDFILKPPENFDFSNYDDYLPYTGDIYVDQKAQIQYGITQVIPIEAILKYLRQHESEVRQAGYDISKLLGND